MSSRKEAVSQEIIQNQKEESIRASENWLMDRRSLLLAGCVSLGLSGCKPLVARGQNDALEPAELIDNPSTPYIGSLTNVWGGEPAKIEGVGLVTGLNGTGSAPGPSRYRDELESDLKIRDVDGINSLLSDKGTSLAVLAGIVPAGAGKGHQFDVFVSLPPGSETKSFYGGYLMPADMSSRKILGGKSRSGRRAGSCKGQVLVNSIFKTSSDSKEQRSGVVPGGGKLSRDRLYGLKLKTDTRSMKLAIGIVKEVNKRFTYFENARKSHVAKNKQNDREIQLNTPEIYKDNIYRYLHVIRQIAVGESPKAKLGRMQALEANLMNPETAEIAALRLEAIGRSSLAILTRGMTHHSPVVQFASAMAVAYLGEDSSSETLARLAVSNANYRWHALTALNAVGGNASASQLRKLLHTPEIETRYAATRSLVSTGQGGGEISSQQFVSRGKDFTLRTVFSTSAPAVHVARYKEAEIVVYNPDVKLEEAAQLFVSGWTVKSVGPETAQIIKYQVGGNDIKIECSSYIVDVVTNLAEKGADYSVIAAILHQAGVDRVINGQVVVSALANPNRLKNPASVSGAFNNEQEALARLDQNRPNRREADDRALKNAAKKPSFAERLRGFGR